MCALPATEHAILAKELQVNLRVYSTVGQVAEAGGGGRSIDWGSAETYRAGATDLRFFLPSSSIVLHVS